MKTFLQNSLSRQGDYSTRTVDYFVDQIDANVRESFTPEQLTEVRTVVQAAMPQPAPKIVDLRVNIDLLISRFYIVLFVGKERRKNPRPYTASGFTAFANRVAAIILLVGLNLTISLFIFLVAYLIKSALGVNLFTSHLSDYLRR
jgi:hypothetical protein